jgi:hypothetical protein
MSEHHGKMVRLVSAFVCSHELCLRCSGSSLAAILTSRTCNIFTTTCMFSIQRPNSGYINWKLICAIFLNFLFPQEATEISGVTLLHQWSALAQVIGDKLYYFGGCSSNRLFVLLIDSQIQPRCCCIPFHAACSSAVCVQSVFGVGSQCYALSNHFVIMVDAQSVYSQCQAAGSGLVQL